MRQAQAVSPLAKVFRIATVAALLGIAVLVYLNFDTLRALRFDLSHVTDAFKDVVDEVEEARRGGELETGTVEDTSIAGVRMETSLGDEPPPTDETPAPAVETPPAQPPAAEPPAEAANDADEPRPIARPEPEPEPQVAAPEPQPPPATVAREEPPPRAVAREEPRPVAPPEPEGPVAPETFGFGLEVMTVSEADPSARVLVLRDGGRRGVATIRWWTTNGTATAGSDFARLEPRTERFGVGEQNRTLLIPIIGDRVAEGPENFFVHIALDDGPQPEPVAQIEVIILDDD